MLKVGKGATSPYEKMLSGNAAAEESLPEEVSEGAEESMESVELPPALADAWEQLKQGVERRNFKLIQEAVSILDQAFLPSFSEEETIPPTE